MVLVVFGPMAPEQSVTSKGKKRKFLAMWGQIPTDWFEAPPKVAGGYGLVRKKVSCYRKFLTEGD